MSKAKNRYGRKSSKQNTASYFLQELRNDEENRKRRFEEDVGGTVQPQSKTPSTLSNTYSTIDSAATICTAKTVPTLITKPKLNPRPRRNKVQISPVTTINNMDEVLESLQNRSTAPVNMPYRTDGDFTGLQALTDDLVSMVLELILKSERSIKPVYQAGMMAWGVRSTSEDEDIVQFENVDLSVLQVNKRIHRLGSEMFYGSHTFHFDRPERCKWWIKRIGSNFRKVRHLSLVFSTGWLQSREESSWACFDPCVFEDMCCEEQWCNVLSAYIQPQHNLHTLQIILLGWRDWRRCNRYSSRPSGVPTRPADQHALEDWRNSIFEFLRAYMRGIRRATLRQADGIWFAEQDLSWLGLLMQQNRQSATQRSKKRKVGLTEALQYVMLSQHE